MTIVLRGALLAAFTLAVVRPATAQMYELVGTRAQGMGGAFVAVADDATASWWNPAGLASGATVSAVYDRSTNTEPEVGPDHGPAWLSQSTVFAFSTPAFGLSYYRLRISEIQPVSANGAGSSDRQEEGAIPVDLRTFALTQLGSTVGQSVGGHLVIGSTLKLLRAGRAVSLDGGSGRARDRLDEAGSADVDQEWETDLDVGAMVTVSRMRFGVSVKHVREPEFGEGESRLELKRQARAGAAVTGGSGSGPFSAITAAVDADLTRLQTGLGEVRHVAAGAEAWLFDRKVGVRGGFNTNTVGDTANSTSVGISLGSRDGGYYVDGFLTVGSDESRDGWGLSFRLSY
jgi:hypothetical protein